MIWNDSKIREWASNGGVTPYDDGLVNPASLDLRLGHFIRRHHPIWERLSVIDMRQKIEDGTIEHLPKWGVAEPFKVEWLMPGEFTLLHSLEAVCIPPSAASILVLKSSKGRDGYNHSHSGWGDPGFGYPKEILLDCPSDVSMCVVEPPPQKGAQWTFEVKNIAKWPVKLEAGMPFIQMIMMDMIDLPQVDYRYTGHYVYQNGPTFAYESRG